MKITQNLKKGKLEVFKGFITDYPVDAIVCPANTNLNDCTASGNAHYLIAQLGGSEIFEEAREVANKCASKNGMQKYGNLMAKVPVYSAHITGSGKLPHADHVIHSASVDFDLMGRMYYNYRVIEKSAKNVLELGNAMGLKSIGFPTFPTISTLVSDEVTLEDSLEAISEASIKHMVGETSIEKVGIALTDEKNYESAKWFMINKFARIL